ncbi:hypothetical protein J6590_041919 [Homalodisca vitripennis]|nr:hypothetical protein J6590_041919 [Homalodisca vitripennis]
MADFHDSNRHVKIFVSTTRLNPVTQLVFAPSERAQRAKTAAVPWRFQTSSCNGTIGQGRRHGERIAEENGSDHIGSWSDALATPFPAQFTSPYAGLHNPCVTWDLSDTAFASEVRLLEPVALKPSA